MPSSAKITKVSIDVRQIICNDLDAALNYLKNTLSDRNVHSLRKRLKHARAALRLLRPQLGESKYRGLNLSIRDIARSLVRLRDTKVLCDLLSGQSKTLGYSVKREMSSILVKAARSELRSERMSHSISCRINQRKRLWQVRHNLKSVECRKLEYRDSVPLLTMGYQKAFTSFWLTHERASTKRLHECRKQVKYNLHQWKIMMRVEPKWMQSFTSRGQDIAEYLGSDRDLALLRDWCAIKLATTHDSGQIEHLNTLINSIDRRRIELQRKVYRLGEKAYRDKPKKMKVRLCKFK